jgi:hypothetical protein
MVDVSSVRNILSRIRKVVTGDIILPEDHNLQTDAIAKLTDIVETISPGGAVEIPVVIPFPYTREEILDESDYYIGPFVYNDVETWIMPFTVKLKKWFFVVTYNTQRGPSYLTLLDNGNTIASATIPPGTTGTYSIPLNDYILQEGHDFLLHVYVPTPCPPWTCSLFIDCCWVLGVIV